MSPIKSSFACACAAFFLYSSMSSAVEVQETPDNKTIARPHPKEEPSPPEEVYTFSFTRADLLRNLEAIGKSVPDPRVIELLRDPHLTTKLSHHATLIRCIGNSKARDAQWDHFIRHRADLDARMRLAYTVDIHGKAQRLETLFWLLDKANVRGSAELLRGVLHGIRKVMGGDHFDILRRITETGYHETFLPAVDVLFAGIDPHYRELGWALLLRRDHTDFYKDHGAVLFAALPHTPQEKAQETLDRALMSLFDDKRRETLALCGHHLIDVMGRTLSKEHRQKAYLSLIEGFRDSREYDSRDVCTSPHIRAAVKLYETFGTREGYDGILKGTVAPNGVLWHAALTSPPPVEGHTRDANTFKNKGLMMALNTILGRAPQTLPMRPGSHVQSFSHDDRQSAGAAILLANSLFPFVRVSEAQHMEPETLAGETGPLMELALEAHTRDAVLLIQYDDEFNETLARMVEKKKVEDVPPDSTPERLALLATGEARPKTDAIMLAMAEECGDNVEGLKYYASLFDQSHIPQTAKGIARANLTHESYLVRAQAIRVLGASKYWLSLLDLIKDPECQPEHLLPIAELIPVDGPSQEAYDYIARIHELKGHKIRRQAILRIKAEKEQALLLDVLGDILKEGTISEALQEMIVSMASEKTLQKLIPLLRRMIMSELHILAKLQKRTWWELDDLKTLVRIVEQVGEKEQLDADLKAAVLEISRYGWEGCRQAHALMSQDAQRAMDKELVWIMKNQNPPEPEEKKGWLSKKKEPKPTPNYSPIYRALAYVLITDPKKRNDRFIIDAFSKSSEDSCPVFAPQEEGEPWIWKAGWTGPIFERMHPDNKVELLAAFLRQAWYNTNKSRGRIIVPTLRQKRVIIDANGCRGEVPQPSAVYSLEETGMDSQPDLDLRHLIGPVRCPFLHKSWDESLWKALWPDKDMSRYSRRRY